jgi:hypothetical protein
MACASPGTVTAFSMVRVMTFSALGFSLNPSAFAKLIIVHATIAATKANFKVFIITSVFKVLLMNE